MKFIRLLAGALALVCAPAHAQSPSARQVATVPLSYSPNVTIYCDDGTGHTAACSPTGGSTPTGPLLDIHSRVSAGRRS